MAHRGPELAAAYATCRSIARREAKNFYYAFLALPRHKSDAMCAVYAFMRRADDIADDESLSIDARRATMAEWTAAFRQAQSGEATSDPVFLALLDTQQQFGISGSLLQDLVRGTTMDLDEQRDASAQTNNGANHFHPQQYETFGDLYEYCYLVASVVGLVCIRIFGYTDQRAEKLAEKTGIAFQLTNILRDVREDVERGRVYLPQKDLEEFSVSGEELAGIKDGRKLTLNQRELLEFQAQRAREYYKAADDLLPLIEADSRPALWVLVTIYRSLLDRIDAKSYDVFTKRIKVGKLKKLSILSVGLARAAANRMGL